MTDGIIMVPMGHRYAMQAKRNIKSIRLGIKSKMYITLFTNVPQMFDGFKDTFNIHVIKSEGKFGFKNQTHYVTKTPYERTLYLDCDAIPIHDTAFQPFQLLHQFAFAGAHAPARGFKQYVNGVPPCFPQFNCGVMFYTKEMIPLMEAWDVRFQRVARAARTNPQGSFARLLYHSAHRLATLPPEFNYRGGVQYFTHRDQVRIAHAPRIPSLIGDDGQLNKTGFDRWFHQSFYRQHQALNAKRKTQ